MVVCSCPCFCAAAVPFVLLSRLIQFLCSTTSVSNVDDDELALVMKELKQNVVRREQAEQIMHGRLLQMAASAVTKV